MLRLTHSKGRVTRQLHVVNDPELVKNYQDVHGWVLSEAVRYSRPPYHHHPGAVVWVDLTKPAKEAMNPKKTANKKRIAKKPAQRT